MTLIKLSDGKTMDVRKVLCVGKNYAEHIKEMSSSMPSKPVFFLKPSTSITQEKKVELPRNIGTIHHEVELAIVLGEGGKNIGEEEALSKVWGYGVLLDITARDLQSVAKNKGQPWTISKGYDGFAPMSIPVPKNQVGSIGELAISLEVNGQKRQSGNTRDMLFKPSYLISWISKVMTLEKGDIIATGTPAGVGPVEPGDKVAARIERVGEIEIEFL
ncbi:MAG: fumarylacetoacetate hydrolase family protein [Candidatus Thermoplasmatota archaeon]|nr:fumarylacetoacetate hydrolase family protein [Candidatus Thermoplasmatota archaeon]